MARSHRVDGSGEVAPGRDRFLRLFLQYHSVLDEEVAEGAMDRARALRLPWIVDQVPRGEWTEAENPDCLGMLTVLSSDEEDRWARRLPFPVVNFSNARGPRPAVANFLSDDRAVGRAAARLLLGRGYRHLLVLRQEGSVAADERAEGFVSQCGPLPVRKVWLSYRRDAGPWNPEAFQRHVGEQLRLELADLPLDLAVFATNDSIAWLALRALERWFPERLYTTALLGVDNQHERFYGGTTQGLSSVCPGFRDMGSAALEWLAGNAGNRAAAKGQVLRFPPSGIVERSTTAGAPCADPITARLMRLAWRRVQDGEPVTVAELASMGSMSRRSLERRFDEHLGRPAQEVIGGMRVDLALRLLEQTRLSVAQVSQRCGYSKQETLTRAVARATGLTPLAWRRSRARNSAGVP